MTLLARIFASLPNAEEAREALLAAGFDAARLHLSARHDEAGPVEGNFLVGNGKDDAQSRTGFSPATGGESANPYQHNFANPVDRGVFMLTVDAEDHAQSERAADIMSRCGAVDVDELTGARNFSSG